MHIEEVIALLATEGLPVSSQLISRLIRAGKIARPPTGQNRLVFGNDHVAALRAWLQAHPHASRGRAHLETSVVDKAEALQLYLAGWTLRKLASKYGVSRQRVSQRLQPLLAGLSEKVFSCPRCELPFTAAITGSTFLCPRCCETPYVRTRHKTGTCPDCHCATSEPGHRCQSCWGKSIRKLDFELVAQLYLQGYSLRLIANHFHVWIRAITGALTVCGIARRPRGGRYKPPQQLIGAAIVAYHERAAVPAGSCIPPQPV